MNMLQVREIARERGVKAGKLRKAELIRLMQREEGNDDCFEGTAATGCHQDACLWREDCLAGVRKAS